MGGASGDKRRGLLQPGEDNVASRHNRTGPTNPKGVVNVVDRAVVRAGAVQGGQRRVEQEAETVCNDVIVVAMVV